MDACKIVIMSADKGGAVVILEADHYKRMVEEVFHDPQYFEESDGNQMKTTMNKIAALCRKYSSNLTKEEVTYLTRFDYREANFYGLPKIHKSKLIKDVTVVRGTGWGSGLFSLCQEQIALLINFTEISIE